jgi:hypothetical protein
MTDKSLVVTLRLDQESQDYFNGLRRAYLPALSNPREAHITLLNLLY